MQSLNTLKSFAFTHDEMPAFHAAYFVLTAIVALTFNLGTFAMLIAIHIALDLVKYRHRHSFSWIGTWKGALRESLLDLTLVCLGLAFAVYLHHSLAHIAVLSGLALAEITIIRFAASFSTKLKILCDVMGVFLHLEHYMAIRHPRIAKPFTGLEKLCFVSIAACLFLLVIATPLLHIDIASLGHIILDEMVPGFA